MTPKEARGYCESCDTFEVEQSKDLTHLVNSCKVSGGKLKVRCTKWHKEEPVEETKPRDEALAFIPKFQDVSNH
jgi:hypothetical protein